MKNKFLVILCLAFISCFFLQASSVSFEADPTEVTILGTITDENGKPVKAFVSVLSDKWESLDWTKSDNAGKYSFQVPPHDAYIVQIQPVEKIKLGPASFVSGFLDQYQYATPTNNEAMVNFTVQPGGVIWLNTYTPDGEYVFQQDKHSNWNVGVYPLGGTPAQPSLQYFNHQNNTFWGWQEGNDKNHPALLVQADTPVELWVHWPVPEVGDTFLHLDHDGQGYRVGQGELLQINVLYDAALTEYRDFQKLLQEYQSAGYAFDDEILHWNSTAGEALEEAKQECSTNDPKICIPASYTVLTNILRAREEAVMQAAKQDIEAYRKLDASIQFIDCAGTPISGIPVQYQQTSHDFIFAAGWPTKPQYDILKQNGFNSASDGGFWKQNLAGKKIFIYADDTFNPIIDAGLDIVMHTGIWITPDFVPVFFDQMDNASLVTLARDFSYKFTNHYAEKMNIYNAFNEPQGAFYHRDFSLQEILDITAASVQGANEGAPGVPTYVNFYNMYLGDLAWTPNPANETFPYSDQLIQAMIDQNIPFDNIGLEFYNGVVAPTIDIGIFNDTLEYYQQYEKPIFISELSYGTTEDLGNYVNTKPWYRNGWHGGHTDQTQAEWAYYTYTVAFSKPYINGIMWVSSSELQKHDPFAGDALFDLDDTPRPVVSTIGDLIHSWTTSGESTTTADGTLTLRGFAGEYTLNWSDPNGTQESSEIHIQEGGENQFVIRPPVCPNAEPGAAPVKTSTVPPAPETNRSSSVLIIGMIGSVLLVGSIIFVLAKNKNQTLQVK